MRSTILAGTLGVSLFALTITACEKNNDNSTGSTNLKIQLTDAPYNAQQVNVDIQQVRLNFSSQDSTQWSDLNTIGGVYNLLDLQNGIDTVLAQGDVPTGTLKGVRFVLGPNNSIMVDSVVYPLTVPSGSESGLKIVLNKQLAAHADSLIIDFDAALSVIRTGNGQYMLKPVLHIK
jgi:hypothetical protein